MLYKHTIALAMLRGLASAEVPWACRADKQHMPEPNAYVTGVDGSDMYKLADKKVMPNGSDLKGKDIDSLVEVKILIGTDGSVRCARVASADPLLAQRSLIAAWKWHYRADSLKREMVNVETSILFVYTGDTVVSIPYLP